MSLPNPGMDAVPFTPLTAEFLDDMIENIEALAVGSGLDDAAITPAKLVAGSGTDWNWQDWTPTFTNLASGTLNYAKYLQIGKIVFFNLKYTMSGANVSGLIGLTLPISYELATAASTDVFNIRVEYNNTNGLAYPGMAAQQDTSSPANKISLYAYSTGGSYVSFASTSSTKPFTWASTDYIIVTGFYKVA